MNTAVRKTSAGYDVFVAGRRVATVERAAVRSYRYARDRALTYATGYTVRQVWRVWDAGGRRRGGDYRTRDAAIAYVEALVVTADGSVRP